MHVFLSLSLKQHRSFQKKKKGGGAGGNVGRPAADLHCNKAPRHIVLSTASMPLTNHN